ncbi:restriction endonuclease [Corallococcus carmarthensis]|uniref:restriction endonuclease n=1 Tax=Corallococcus carmarthensis TaxID=2316728 RepID=UPI00148D9C24|nr:restriction endonuclease [Corallococcus carmarthensis]NOK17451.1 hypothetical protein [Corallococcus carmarthensis]
MPSPVTASLPLPKSWDEFEDIVADILKLRWGTPNVTRNGRSGQSQNGVDIYGRAKHLEGSYAGAQCKKVSAPVAWEDVEREVNKADDFVPPLGEYLFATTASRDASIQKAARLFNEDRRRLGKCAVEILFWEDLCLDLAGDQNLLAKHFPGWSRIAHGRRQPQISIHWVQGEECRQLFQLEPLPVNTWDLSTQFLPFSSRDLKYLDGKAPDDAVLARAYNDSIAACLIERETYRSWLEHKARERYKKATLCGLAVEVEGAEARDIIVSLEFPDAIDVFRRGGKPALVECPALPLRPMTEIDRMRSRTLGLANFNFGPAFRIPEILGFDYGELDFRMPIAKRWLSIESGRVSARVDRLAPRRVARFDGEDGFFIGAKAREGCFKVEWTADAENLDGPINGTLEIEVKSQATKDS